MRKEQKKGTKGDRERQQKERREERTAASEREERGSERNPPEFVWMKEIVKLSGRMGKVLQP
jgi:hypothetical protein